MSAIKNNVTSMRPDAQTKPQPIIYRINAATEKLGISRNTIYRLVKSGNLELVKVGERASGITTKSINAFLERGYSS